MNNKLTIAIVALMVAALAAPAVMADVDYTASVVSCNTVVTEYAGGTSFGSIIPCNPSEISPSINLNNTGGADCSVAAKFTTLVGSTYGLVSGTDVIGGSNFSIGPDGSETALADTNTDTSIGTVSANSNEDYDAILSVPCGQAVGSYSGTVQLTFEAV